MHTKGPWRACHDGDCSCKQIWSVTADHPVAKVISGKWGDDYPSLRFVEGTGGEGSIHPKIESHMEQITYGEINEDVAQANARLIAAAPELLEALIRTAKQLQETHGTPTWEENLDEEAQEAIRKAKGD